LSKRKSIGAGMLIGLGALANISVGGWLGALANISVGGWLGALLFATGLLTICINKYQLVTGQFYRMYRDKNILFNLSEILLIFICNLLGVLVIAIITKLLKLDCSMAQEIILAR